MNHEACFEVSVVEWTSLTDEHAHLVFFGHAEAVSFFHYLKRFGLPAVVWQM